MLSLPQSSLERFILSFHVARTSFVVNAITSGSLQETLVMCETAGGEDEEACALAQPAGLDKSDGLNTDEASALAKPEQ